MTDDHLVEAIRAGDESALSKIISRYSGYVGAIVWNILRSTMTLDDAQEVVSDAFYALWNHADRVQPGKLKAYLAGIARNRARSALRHAGKDVPLEDDILTLPDADPEDAVMREAEYAALRKALEEMSDPDQEIFLRHYYYYQTTAQIASELQMNINTVQSKLRRGRETLRQKLIQGGEVDG